MSDPIRAWTQRYGHGPQGLALPDLNPVLEQLLAHRSVRSYLPRALPEGALELIAAAAQSASTSSNLQAWSLVAVQDAGRKARLAALAADQAHVREAPLLLVWIADTARLAAMAHEQGSACEGLEFLEALLLGVIDAALAAQNAVIALESLGLCCCYIGAMRNKPEAVAAELALPPGSFAVFGLCVGYPDPARPAAIKPRLPQAAVVHHEQYSQAAQTPAIGEYDAVMARFYAEQGMRQPDWSHHSVNRVRTPAALHGRDRLAQALRALGFALR